MLSWVKNIFYRLMGYEQCVQTFTLSCCLGIYIAFCPFVGFHTVMIFLFSWLFALNATVALAVSMAINNPWTMVPVYGVGYLCGDRVLSWCGFVHGAWNPLWVSKANEWLVQYVGGSGISLWAFLLGGNLVGLSCALLGYPIIKRIARMAVSQKEKVLQTVCKSKQAVVVLAEKAKPVLQRVAQHKQRETV